MITDYIELKQEFIRIKKMGLIKSQRNGTSGVGYTFEKMLNLDENQSPKPDYHSIELKCRYGYSKSNIRLFSLKGERIGETANSYIFAKYSYYRYKDPNDYRLFSRKIFSKQKYELNGISFLLKVDYGRKLLTMNSYYRENFIEEVCFWTFDDLKAILTSKMETTAIVTAYPYRYNNELFFKYFYMDIYILKTFDDFLRLIEEDKIYVEIYMRESVNKHGDYKIQNNGTNFIIKFDSINELFLKYTRIK